MRQRQLHLIKARFARHNSESDRSISRLFLRISCYLTLPVFVLWLIAPAPATTFLWDWSNAIGYVAGVLLLLLFLYRGQVQNIPAFNGRFFINLHRDLGYLALIFTGAHIGVLLISEPLLLEHLKLTAPWYMLSGLVAATLLIVLIILSMPTLRKRVWNDYRVFRYHHLLMSVAVILFLFGHLLGSQYYANSLWKQLLLMVTGCYVIMRYFMSRKYAKFNGSNNTARLRSRASASLLVSAGSLMLMLLVTLLLVWVTRILTSNA